jgi:hypothetical protein
MNSVELPKPKSETLGTSRIYVLEFDAIIPPPGTKARPRPTDRPRLCGQQIQPQQQALVAGLDIDVISSAPQQSTDQAKH